MEKLKRIIKRSLLTQAEFAGKLGVHPRTLKKYLDNEMEPRASIAYRIIQLCGEDKITLEDIVKEWL